MARLVEQFTAQLEHQIQDLQKAWNQQDHHALKALSLIMKKSAGGYGFSTLAFAAGEVESALRHHEENDDLAVRVESLIDLCWRAAATAPGPPPDAAANPKMDPSHANRRDQETSDLNQEE